MTGRHRRPLGAIAVAGLVAAGCGSPASPSSDQASTSAQPSTPPAGGSPSAATGAGSDSSTSSSTTAATSSASTRLRIGGATSTGVTDATLVRDDVLRAAAASITATSGSAADAWGLGPVLVGAVPTSIQVSVQTGDVTAQPPATPQRVVLVAQEREGGDILVVVAQDAAGHCEAGGLSGAPPNQNPQTRSIPAGTACGGAAALSALGD